MTVSIPLDKALFCDDCGMVTERQPGDRCAICQSLATLPLDNILNRKPARRIEEMQALRDAILPRYDVPSYDSIRELLHVPKE